MQCVPAEGQAIFHAVGASVITTRLTRRTRDAPYSRRVSITDFATRISRGCTSMC
jgi:hypothetical protein